MPDFDLNLNPILVNSNKQLPNLPNPSSTTPSAYPDLSGPRNSGSDDALSVIFRNTGVKSQEMLPTASAQELYDNRRYATYDPNIVDVENQKAYAQSNWDKATNGVLKGLNLTATTIAGGFGMLYGTGKWAFGGKLSDIWDNDVMQGLDKWNNEVDQTYLPNYYTNAEKNASWYSMDNWFKTNFLFDKLIKNSGYAVGAMLSGNIANAGLTKAGSLIGKLAASGATAAETSQAFKLFTPLLRNTARAFSQGKNIEAAQILEKQLSSIVDIEKASSELTKIASLTNKFSNFGDKARRTLIAGYSSAGEAGFEALQTGNEFRKNLIQEYKDNNNGEEPTGDTLKEIDNLTASVGKSSFFANLAILGLTEYVQLPKLLGSSYAAERQAANSLLGQADDVVLREGKYVAKGPLATIGKIANRVGRTGGYFVDPKEGLQEGLQYAAQVGIQNYFEKGYKGQDASVWVDAFLYGLNGVNEEGEGVGAFNSKEGAEGILLGAITGGPMQAFGKQGNINRNRVKASNTNQFIQTLDNAPTFKEAFKERLVSANRAVVLQQEQQNQVINGNKLESRDLETDLLHNYLAPRIKYGRYDMVLGDIQDLRQTSSTETGLASLKEEGMANINDTIQSYQKRLNNFEKYAKNLENLYKYVNLTYGGQTVTNSEGQLVKKYSSIHLDKMVYAASKIADYDTRIPQLSETLLAKGIDVQSIVDDELTNDSPTKLQEELKKINALEDINKDSLKENLQDVIELSKRRKQFFNEYEAIKNNPDRFYEPEEVDNTKPVVIEQYTEPKDKKSAVQSKELELGKEYSLLSPIIVSGDKIITNPKISVTSQTLGSEYETILPSGEKTFLTPQQFKEYNLTDTEHKPETIKKITEEVIKELADTEKYKDVITTPTLDFVNSLGNKTLLNTIVDKVNEKYDELVVAVEKIAKQREELERQQKEIEKKSGTVATGNPENENIEPETAKKSAAKFFKSSVTESEDWNNPDESAKHIVNAREFLLNAKNFSNRDALRAILVTPNSEKQLGLAGLTNLSYGSMNQSESTNVEKGFVAQVFIEQDGNKLFFVNKEGKRIGEVGKQIDNIDDVIFQTMPTTSTITSKGSKRARNGEEEDFELEAKRWKAYREQLFKQDVKDIGIYEFNISRGVPVMSEDGSKSHVADVLKIPQKLIVKQQDLIQISTSGFITHNGQNIGFPKGRPVLQYGDTLQALDNTKITASESETIYHCILEIANNILNATKEGKKFNISGSQYAKFLQNILFWGKGQKSDNQIYIDGSNLHVGKSSFPITEVADKQSEIREAVTGIYRNVNNTTLRDLSVPFYELKFNESKLEEVKWKSYQEYLLSSKNPDGSKRKTESTPLVTGVVSYKQKYSTLEQIEYPQAVTPVKQEAKTETPKTENTISIMGENIPFTYTEENGDFKVNITASEATKRLANNNESYEEGKTLLQKYTQKLKDINLPVPDKPEQIIIDFLSLQKAAQLKIAKINEFVKRIINGENLSSPEDIQFYENNKILIEKRLKETSQEKEVVKPTEVKVGEQPNVSDIEAKKADIERRRQEELKKLDNLNIGDTVTYLEKNSDNKYIDVTVVNVDNEIGELILKGNINTPPGGVFDVDTVFIFTNAKYDAELKAVESLLSKDKTPTASDVESQVNNTENLTNEEEKTAPLDVKKIKPRDAEYMRIGGELVSASPEQFEEFKKWHKENVPNIPFEVLNNLIDTFDGEKAFGVFENGVAKFYKGAPGTTAYHEAFEGIWKHFLTLDEKNAIINELRDSVADFKDRASGKILNYATATDEQIKERIADDFGEFKAGKIPAKSLLSKIVDFFRNIMNFFKSFVQKPTLKQQLFKEIDKGRFKESKITKKQVKIGVKELFDSNPELANQVYEALGFKNKTQIAQIKTNNKIITQYSDGTFDVIVDEEAYNKAKEKYNDNFKKRKNAIPQLIEDFKSGKREGWGDDFLTDIIKNTFNGQFKYDKELNSFVTEEIEGDEENVDEGFKPAKFDKVTGKIGNRLGFNKVAESEIFKKLTKANNKILKDDLGILDLWKSQEGINRTKNEVQSNYDLYEFDKYKQLNKEFIAPKNKGYVIRTVNGGLLNDLYGSSGIQTAVVYQENGTMPLKDAKGNYKYDAYMFIDRIDATGVYIRYTEVKSDLRGKGISKLLLNRVRELYPNLPIHRTMIHNPIIVKQSLKINGVTDKKGNKLIGLKTDNDIKKWLENNDELIIPPLSNQITLQQKQQALQLYSQYLDTIFPDSKVKDIVYHGTKSDIVKYKNRDGIHFGEKSAALGLIEEKFGLFDEELDNALKSGEVKLISNILNITNLKRSEDIGTNWNSLNKDGVDGVSYYAVEGGESYVVFQPEQIHILGSKQDIEGFKEFVKNNIEYSRVPGLTETQVYELTQDMTSLASFYLFGIDNKKSLYDIAKVTSKELFDWIKGEYIKQDLYEQLGDKRWNQLVNYTKDNLKTIGVSFKKNEDNVDEETIDINTEGANKNDYDSNPFKQDWKKNSPYAVKLSLMVPKTVYTNQENKTTLEIPERQTTSYQGYKLANFNKLFVNLMNKLSNTTDVNKFINKFFTLAKTESDLVVPLKRLGINLDGSIDFSKFQKDDWRLFVDYFKVFTKQRPDAVIQYTDNGSVYIAPANQFTASKAIEAEWFENMKAKGNKIVKKNKEKKTYTVDLTDIKFPKTIEQTLDFLDELGVVFPIDVYNRLSKKDQSKVLKAGGNIYTHIQSNPNVATLDGKLLGINGPLNTLSSILVNTTNPNIDSTHFNVEGERVGSYTENNYPSEFENLFNESKTLDELLEAMPQLKDVYAKGSQFLKKGGLFFDEDGNRIATIKVGTTGGVKNLNEDEGTSISKLTLGNRFMQEINNNLQGNYYILIPADGSTEWMLNLGNVISFDDVREGRATKQINDIFIGYLKDEIQLALQDRSFIANIGNKAQQLRFFREILLEKDVKKIEDIISSNNTLEEKNILLNEYIKENSDSIKESIQTYIKSSVKDLQTTLETNQQIKRAADNTYSIPNILSEFLSSNKLSQGEISETELNNILTFVQANYIIANTEFHKVLFGDPYQFKDETKRIKSFLSPRRRTFDTPAFNNFLNKEYNKAGDIELDENEFGYYTHKAYTNTSTLSDINILGSVAMMEDMPKAIRDAYSKTNEADAASFILDNTYREVKLKNQQWSDKSEKWHQWHLAYARQNMPGYEYTNKELAKQDAIIISKPEPDFIADVIKPIVSGIKYNQDFANLALDKMSQMPLYYKWVQGTNLEKLYLQMHKENKGYVVMISGRKVGSEGEHSIYNSNGSFNTEAFNNNIQIPWTAYGIQVENAFEKPKDQTRGSQPVKLVTVDLYENGKPIGATLERQEVIRKANERYNSILNEHHQALYNQLISKLGVEDMGDSFKLINPVAISETLANELLRREMNRNDKETIQLDENGEFKIPFEASPAYYKIKAILYSLVNKALISPKMNGAPHVQAPVTGWEGGNRKLAEKTKDGYKRITQKEYDSLSEERKKNVIPTDDTLKFYEDEDGKRCCEVMLHHWFGEKLGKHVNKTEEELINYLNNHPDGKKILMGIGFRIPTQSISSIEVFKVKGFLPKSMGYTVVVPSEITTKAGSDFDIDKLNTYLKSIYIDSDGDIRLVKYYNNEQETKDFYKKVYESTIQKEINKLSKFNEFRDQLFNVFSQLESLEEFTLDNIRTALSKEDFDFYNQHTDILQEIINQAAEEDINPSVYINEQIERLGVSKEKLTAKLLNDSLKEKYVNDMYRKAIENEYYSSMEELLTLPEVFERMLTPVGDAGLKDLATSISKLRNENEDSIKTKMLNRDYLTKLRHAFVTGKRWVGIAATNITAHSIFQKSDVYIDPSKFSEQSKKDQFFLGDGSIILPHNKNEQGLPSLSGVYTADKSSTISERLSGYATAAVDIAKDPFVMTLFKSDRHFSLGLFLERLGCGETGVKFLQQPIITEYLKYLDATNQKGLFNKANIEAIKDRFPTIQEYVKNSEINIQDFDKNIKYFANNDILFHSANIESNAQNEKFAAIQHLILDEFLKYAKMAEFNFKITQAINYDTTRFGSGDALTRKQIKTEQAKKNIISNVDEILSNTFLKTQSELLDKSMNAMGPILKLEERSIRDITDEILRPYAEREFMADDDFDKISNKIKLSFLDFLIQTKTGINNDIAKLLLNETGNIQEQLEAAKKKHPQLQILKDFVIESSKLIGGAKTIKLKVNAKEAFEEDNYIAMMEELKEIEPELYNSIIKTSILQGTAQTSVSISNIVPVEDRAKIISPIINTLVATPDVQAFSKGAFQRSNWKDDSIVPMIDMFNAREIDNPDPWIDQYGNEIAAYEIFDVPRFNNKKSDIVYLSEYNALQSGDFIKIPRVVTAKTKEGNVKVNVITGREVTDADIRRMAATGNFSFKDVIGYQLVRDVTGEPVTITQFGQDGTEYIKYVYKKINLYGDGKFTTEYRLDNSPSQINNGTIKTQEEIPDNVIIQHFGGIAKKQSSTKQNKDVSLPQKQNNKILRPLFTVEKARQQSIFRKEHKLQETNDPKISANRNKITGVISYNPEVLKQKFESKAWTNPRTQEDKSLATALKENQFGTFDEFFTFVILHESYHASILKQENETIGQYEDRINKAALEDLEKNYNLNQTKTITLKDNKSYDVNTITESNKSPKFKLGEDLDISQELNKNKQSEC